MFYLLMSYTISELTRYGKTRKQSKSGVKSTKKKGVRKSRHLNVLRRRLKKWVNDSDHGHVVIETLTHPMKNNKAIISLRQFRLNKDNKRSKAVFGDLMVIHSDKLDSCIKRLQKIRDNLKNNTINEIVIDEWDLKAEQSKLRKQLSEFAAEKI